MECTRRRVAYVGVQALIIWGLIISLAVMCFSSESTWAAAFPVHTHMWKEGIIAACTAALCLQIAISFYLFVRFVQRLFDNQAPVLQEAQPLRQPAPWDNGRPPRMVRRYEVNGHAVSLL